MYFLILNLRLISFKLHSHIIHIHLHAEAYSTHYKDELHSSLEKYTSHFIWKACVWEGVGDRQELQHVDPLSSGHNSVSFRFVLGPSLSGTCSHSSIFSPTATSQSGAWGPTLLGAGFLYRISTPTHLQLTDFLSSPG